MKGKGRPNIVVQMKSAKAIEAIATGNSRTQKELLHAKVAEALIKLLKVIRLNQTFTFVVVRWEIIECIHYNFTL